MSPTRLLVVVAAGRKLTLPHPSGIKELPGRVLKGGDTFETTPETAGALLQEGLIAGPGIEIDGASRTQPAPAPSRGVSIAVGGGRMRALGRGEIADLSGGIPENLGMSSENRPPPGRVPLHDCTGGGRTLIQLQANSLDGPNGPAVVTSDGREWPSW